MDFRRYAEGSAALLNADLGELDGLTDLLADRPAVQARATRRDCDLLGTFQRELRPAFEAGSARDAVTVLRTVNDLLAQHPLTPRISDHDGDLRLRVVAPSGSVAELLIGESLLGLASVVADLGPYRLGVCAADSCDRAFVDVSPNQSRRYCSERCSSRANVAAYRARRRAVTGS